MLRIEVDAAALGRVRFALSPLAVAWDALMLAAEGDAPRRPADRGESPQRAARAAA
ncbi:hypothetical protein [Catenulispora pinisilvae]|uniref:hypothetical protein n=1 Tax=Catenulispora pinisilvae TaxID=2705253 RepID=UPI001892366F|nr:hypothetical protein [Catenulispora pinisilvae]